MLALMIIVLAGIFFLLRVFIAVSAEQKCPRQPTVTNLACETGESRTALDRSAKVLAFRARLNAARPPRQTVRRDAAHHLHG
jgi:hypothetical protein